MKLLLVLPLLLVLIVMAPAFGQLTNESIVVTTDKASYSEGETIVITGEVREFYSGTPVSVFVYTPNGELVSIAQIDVGADKKFSTEMTAGGALMTTLGTYSVTVQYGTESRSAETTFEFGGAELSLAVTTTNQTEIIEQVPTIVGSEIPAWVRGIFVFWVDGNISDQDLINTIKFLVDTKVIVLE